MTTMKRTAVIAMTALCALFLAPTGPASASPRWVPDAVIVQDVPRALTAAADRQLLDQVGAKPGDVLPVEWREEAGCTLGHCAYVLGEEGPILVPEGTVALVPHGPDSAAGSTVYPSYTRAMAYDTTKDGLLNEGPYDSDPTEVGYGFVDGPARGVVWTSGEQVTDALTGEQWIRVAYGTADAWVRTERLSEIPAALGVEDGKAQPNETETIHEVEPALPTPNMSNAAAVQEDGGFMEILVAGGALFLILIGSLLWKRGIRHEDDA